MLESRVCRPRRLIEHVKWVFVGICFSAHDVVRRYIARENLGSVMSKTREDYFAKRVRRYRDRGKQPLISARTKDSGKTRTARENVRTANDRGRMEIVIKIYIRRRNGTCANEMRRMIERGTTLRAGGRTAFTTVREEALPSERTLN